MSIMETQYIYGNSSSDNKVSKLQSNEGVLFNKDSDIVLPDRATRALFKCYNDVHVVWKNKHILAKITSAQRSICATIDLMQ